MIKNYRLYLFLKLKKSGRLETRLNKLKIVQEKKNFFYCQEKAWCDSNIFLNWLNNIYIKKNKTFKIKQK